MFTNTLYYGDNLDVMREFIPDESVDLVYLDPPFNSARDYNVLFKQAKRDENQAQITAFTDTWLWSKRHYQEFFDDPRNARLFDLMEALHRILGQSEMMAYLVMMAPRLLELHRVMKSTASLYLHCDPTASHYLRLLLDQVFGLTNFVNEIAWQRSAAKGHAFTRFPSAQDVLLFYGKSPDRTWHTQHTAHREEYVSSHYSGVEPGTERRYRLDNCLNPNPNRPNLTYEWNGQVRVWRWTRKKMQQLHDAGRLVYSKSGTPQYKRYLDEMAGTTVTSVWTDISPINSQAA